MEASGAKVGDGTAGTSGMTAGTSGMATASGMVADSIGMTAENADTQSRDGQRPYSPTESIDEWAEKLILEQRSSRPPSALKEEGVRQ
jgi:hypothetical protein